MEESPNPPAGMDEARAGAPPCGTPERWALLLPHVRQLRVLAVSRSATIADAEDCVQEALLRVATYPRLDPERVGELLRAVTLRLTIDMHRARLRRQRMRLHAAMGDPAPAMAEEIAIDRAEGRWLAEHAATLSERERRALLYRAVGMPSGEAAHLLGISYKAAENALSRARLRLRLLAAAASTVAVALWQRLRGRGATALAMTTAVAFLMATEWIANSWPPPLTARVPAIVDDGGGSLDTFAVPSHLRHGGGLPLPSVVLTAAASDRWRSGATSAAPVAGLRHFTVITVPGIGDKHNGTTPATVTWYHDGRDFITNMKQCLQDGIQLQPGKPMGCPPR